MGIRWITLAVVAASMAACSRDVALLLPLPNDEKATELLNISFADGDEPDRLLAIVTASVAGPLPISIELDDDVRFDALVYDESLDELRIREGAHERTTGQGRCLPLPSLKYTTRIRNGSLTEDWQLVPESLYGVDNLAIVSSGAQGGELVGCLASGRCTTTPGGGCGACPDPVVIAEPTEPTPPDPPMLPTFEEGPPNWVTKTFDGGRIVARQPWADDARACDAGEVRFPGDAGCAPLIGCPVGRWPDGLGSGADVIYVDAEAVGQGLGTPDQPYATIAEAIASIEPAGTATIALAKGLHQIARLTVNVSVSIVGACPAETTIRAVGGRAGSIRAFADLEIERLHYESIGLGVEINGARLTVEHVSMFGGRYAIRAKGNAVARLEDVWIESSSVAVRIEDSSLDATRLGVERSLGAVEVEGGDATITDFIFDGNRSSIEDAGDEYAIWVIDTGDLTLDRGWIKNVVGTAVQTSDGLFEATDLVVSDATPGLVSPGDDRIATGIALDVPMGRADLTRILIERVHRGGIYIGEAGPADVTMTDVVVNGVGPRPDGPDGEGHGVVAFGGGSLVADRIYIEDTQRDGIATTGTATVTNVTVLRVHRDRNTDGGHGAFFSGTAVARRVHIREAEFIGVRVDFRARLHIEDLLVEETGTTEVGRGLHTSGDRTTIDRARFDHQACGLLGGSGVGPIHATDVEIRDLWGRSDSLTPTICGVQMGQRSRGGPSFVAERLRLVNAGGIEIYGSEATLTDVIVDSSDEPVPLITILTSDDRGPLDPVPFADVYAERVVLSGTIENVITVNENTALEARDLTIKPREMGTPAQEAILVRAGATFVAQRFDVGGGRGIGLRACPRSSMSLEDGIVRGDRTAASIPRGFEVEPISQRVRYEAMVFGICDGQPDPCAMRTTPGQ